MSLDLRMDGVGWNVNVILSGSKAEFVKTFESDTQYPDLSMKDRRSLLGKIYDIAAGMHPELKPKEVKTQK